MFIRFIFTLVLCCSLSTYAQDIKVVLSKRLALVDSIPQISLKKPELNAISAVLAAYVKNERFDGFENEGKLPKEIKYVRSNSGEFELFVFWKPLNSMTNYVCWVLKQNGNPISVYQFNDEILYKPLKDKAITNYTPSIETFSFDGYIREALTIKDVASGKDVITLADLALLCDFEKLALCKTDDELDSMNAIVLKRLTILWNDAALFTDDFSEFKRFKTEFSDDKNLKLCTYNVQRKGFEQYFYGAAIFKESPTTVKVYELEDKTNKIRSPERATTSNEKWLGAIYLDIIDVSIKGKTYYTLLGYNGHDEFTKSRVIDVMYLQGNRLVFGHPIFRTDRLTRHRMIYEYSAGTTMMLQYDANLKMIVMDNLEPSESFYTGVYRFYGPDFSYNAFEFVKNEWVFIRDIDLRNPKLPNR